jgi:hypothetical protein
MAATEGPVVSVETVQGYWQMGILWSPLVSGEQTQGQYSLMEQLGDQVLVATKGQMVRVPAGTTHAFAVKSETARVLNFYVPAGLDLQVSMLGTPATAPTLPPEGAEHPPTAEAEKAFTARLHDLATQTMAPESDLLGDYRPAKSSTDSMP